MNNEQLHLMGFKSLGHNVKISDKVSIYGAKHIEIGDHSRIDDFCVISGKISLGRNVHIAPFCLIAGGLPGVVMEDFSGLAYGCKIFSQSDDYSGETMTNPTVPIKYKAEKCAPVLIRRHVILGAGTIVMPGVTVEEGCSVGAMTLVTKSTLPWGIYVGSPAQRIKNRKNNLLALEKEFQREESASSNDSV
ncbi:MAG: acyltransferase [Nitrosomonas sp.]|nr:acyltransferase [Nitrosomonas sp.]